MSPGRASPPIEIAYLAQQNIESRERAAKQPLARVSLEAVISSPTNNYFTLIFQLLEKQHHKTNGTLEYIQHSGESCPISARQNCCSSL